MPETRRSIRTGPGAEPDRHPSRQSIRHMRKNLSAEQAEARAKAQRIAEQKRQNSDPTKINPLDTDLAKAQDHKSKVNSDNDSPTSTPFEDGAVKSPNGGGLGILDEDSHLNSFVNSPDLQPETDNLTKIPYAEPIQHTMEFTIPIPISGITLSQYRKIFSEESKSLEPLLKRKQVSEEMVTKGERFLWRLRNLCINYDLDSYEMQPAADTTPEMLAAWWPSASPKFNFFGKLLDQLKDRELNLLVLAKKLSPKPGTTKVKENVVIDMLETFVTGNNISCARPDQERSFTTSNSEAQLKVTVSSSSADAITALTGPFDLILTFDPDLDTNRPEIDSLRQTSTTGNLTPIISPILLDTIDHVEQVMSPIQTGIDRLQVEILCVTTLRIRLPPDTKDESKPNPLDDYAALIADFVSQGYAPEAWSVPSLGPLNDHESYDLVLGDRFVDQVLPQSQSGTKSPKNGSRARSGSGAAKSVSPKKSGGMKRSRESTVEREGNVLEPLGKKPRVEDADGEDLAMNDAAQLLVVKLETVAAEVVNSAPELERSDSERMITDEPEQTTEETSQVIQVESTPAIKLESTEKAKYLEKIEELEQTVRQQKETIQTRDKNYAIFTKDMDEQCNRYEEQRREMDSLKQNLELTNDKVEMLTKRRLRLEETIDTLKEENRKFKDDLNDARSKLQESTIPEVAEFEALRGQLEEAKRLQAKWEKSCKDRDGTIDFMRAQYQEVGDRALEFAQENEVLQEKVKILERQASGEMYRLQELAAQEAKELQQTDIAILQARYDNAMAVINRLEEEKRTKRPGVFTRAGSVPRSPRVGPTSRAPSPIPDRRIKELKSGAVDYPRQGKTSAASGAVDKPPPARKGKAAASAQEKQEDREKQFRGAPTNPPAAKDSTKLSSPKQSGTDAKGDSKLPDLQPAQPTQARPAIEIKTGPPTSRPFPCCFMPYNCPASFTSKNEWKRHISTKHIQLGFWRCDMCPPNTGGERPSYNDFNRKDLFTQHLRRMHTQQQMMGGTEGLQVQNIVSSNLTEEQIGEIVKRCYKILRLPPPQSSCLFCPRTFSGPTSWEERLEHVGGHLERDRKNGQNCLDLASWREDPVLRDWLLAEGIIEQDSRGGWRIGDGRPRNRGPAASADLPSANAMAGTAPQTPSTPTGHSGGFGSTTGTGADELPPPPADMGSMSRRRRGRPPKRYSELDGPMKLQPNVSPLPISGGDMRSMPNLQPISPAMPGSSPGPPPTAIGQDPMGMQIDSMSGMPVSGPGSQGRRQPPPLLPQPQPRPTESSSPLPTPSAPGFVIGTLPPPPGYPPMSMSSGASHSVPPPPPPPPVLPQILPRTPQPAPGTPQNRNIAPIQPSGSPISSPYTSQHSHPGPLSIAPAPSLTQGSGPMLAPAPAPAPTQLPPPPSQSPMMGGFPLPHDQGQSQMQMQEQIGEHQIQGSGPPPMNMTPPIAAAQVGENDDGKARGRSFREVIM